MPQLLRMAEKRKKGCLSHFVFVPNYIGVSGKGGERFSMDFRMLQAMRLGVSPSSGHSASSGRVRIESGRTPIDIHNFFCVHS